MMIDVLTIGETMVLLQGMEERPLKYSALFSRSIGGAESNVAIGLSRLGKKTRWIGRLGNDPFGDMIAMTLAGENVDVSLAVRDDHHPTAVFFKDSYRLGDPNIYYYRHGSASSKWAPEHVQDHWFENVRHLHMTGITPALGEHTAAFTAEVMQRARERGITVSFDPNVRFKLWSADEARKTLLNLIPLCDMFLPGVDEARFLLGERSPEQLCEQFLQMGAQVVAMKLGAEGSLGMMKNGVTIKVPACKVSHVVDTVGAGDAFAAGFLSVMVDGIEAEHLEKALIRANKLGAYIVQFKGDWEGIPTLKELEGSNMTTR